MAINYLPIVLKISPRYFLIPGYYKTTFYLVSVSSVSTEFSYLIYANGDTNIVIYYYICRYTYVPTEVDSIAVQVLQGTVQHLSWSTLDSYIVVESKLDHNPLRRVTTQSSSV